MSANCITNCQRPEMHFYLFYKHFILCVCVWEHGATELQSAAGGVHTARGSATLEQGCDTGHHEKMELKLRSRISNMFNID